MYLSVFHNYLLNNTEVCLVEHVNVKNHYIIHHPRYIKNRYIKKCKDGAEYFINKSNSDQEKPLIVIKQIDERSNEIETLRVQRDDSDINDAICSFIQTKDDVNLSRCMFKNCSENKLHHKQYCIFHHQKTV